MVSPSEVRVRMYNVGFGDCFLLSFAYDKPTPSLLEPDAARSERHILFDFGTTSKARTRLEPAAIAKAVKFDSGGRLDAVVISHRHADHLSAFGAKTTAAVLRTLEPLLVVRSWTEDPRAAAGAECPVDDKGAVAPANRDAAYLGRLVAGEEVAAKVVARSRAAGRGGQSNLVEAAESAVANRDAVEELARLSRGKRGEYLSAGRATRLNQVAPGVEFVVLGPPKPSQWPDVARQAAESDEFWIAGEPKVSALYATPSSPSKLAPGTARWIVEQLRRSNEASLLSLVRWLDDALNNTSVVLLVKVGEHRMLFSGDAQIENWGWTLRNIDKTRKGHDRRLRAELAAVDFYKVGHHGSRNATPKSLYELWEARKPKRALLSMMSTKAAVHGDEHEVPRGALVAALKELGSIESSDDEAGADWIEARAAVPRGDFQVTRAPKR